MGSKKYNVLIIGAGNIGAFYDKPESKEILTHAHAFSKLNKFNLIGFVDSDIEKAKFAALIWKTEFFKNIRDAFDSNSIDVVCVCVNTQYHYLVLKELVDLPIKLIFVEKPFTKNLEHAQEIIHLCEDRKIPLAVNYSRRFVKEFWNLKEKISSKKYGEFLWGSGIYGKGLFNNGSHLINLFNLLIGGIKRSDFISFNYDYFQDDPSVSSLLRLKNGKDFFLKNIDCNFYTHFEIDLFFQKARIRIVDSGFSVEEFQVSNSKVFKEYKYLIKDKKYNTTLNRSLYFAALNVYEHLEFGQTLKCSGLDVLKDLKICFDIKRNFLNKKNEKKEAITLF